MIMDMDCLLLTYVTDWHPKWRSSIQKGFVQIKTYCTDEITVFECLMGKAYEICTLWVHIRHIVFFYRRQDFFWCFVSSLHLPVQWDGAFSFTILLHFAIIISNLHQQSIWHFFKCWKKSFNKIIIHINTFFDIQLSFIWYMIFITCIYIFINQDQIIKSKSNMQYSI